MNSDISKTNDVQVSTIEPHDVTVVITVELRLYEPSLFELRLMYPNFLLSKTSNSVETLKHAWIVYHYMYYHYLNLLLTHICIWFYRCFVDN
jgi:hypothetical protein